MKSILLFIFLILNEAAFCQTSLTMSNGVSYFFDKHDPTFNNSIASLNICCDQSIQRNNLGVILFFKGSRNTYLDTVVNEAVSVNDLYPHTKSYPEKIIKKEYGLLGVGFRHKREFENYFVQSAVSAVIQPYFSVQKRITVPDPSYEYVVNVVDKFGIGLSLGFSAGYRIANKTNVILNFNQFRIFESTLNKNLFIGELGISHEF